MFFRILKKELKRKRTLNAILFLFIVMATMFLASSVSNLRTVSGAIDYFMEISKVPDYFAVSAIEDAAEDPIESYLKDASDVTEYEVLNSFNLVNDRMKIVKSQSGRKKYERTNTLLLQAVPKNFMKVFDLEGNPLKLSSGEIAVSKLEAEKNELAVGDKIKITVGDVEQEFTVKALVKDVVFGSGMMGLKRHFICREDFEKFAAQNQLVYTKIYCIDFIDLDTFEKYWKEQKFNVISTIDCNAMIPMCYVFDMLMAGILIIVSICLILIAFFVLRFTILFTLQGDFREIGIMKAIGLKDRGIRGVYMVKYFMLAEAGAITGLIFSFPFGNLLLKQVIVNLLTDGTKGNIFIHILCAAGIVAIVLLFANSCTGKLKKFSAIDAIRNGTSGERYRAKNPLKLFKRSRMQPRFYLAGNDILSNSKRFVVLGITFCIGTLLILLPLSAVHTLKGEGIVELFSIHPSNVYIDNGKEDDYIFQKDVAVVERDLEEIQDTLKEHGIKAQVGTDIGYSIPCYSNDKENLFNYYTMQETGPWDRSYALLAGREPKAEDELMITELTAEKMEVSIGDTVTFQYGDREQEFIITGTYQSMMNMGYGFRVSRQAKLEEDYISGIFCLQIHIDGMDETEACAKVKEIFPDYKVMDTQKFMGKIIGSIMEQLDITMWMLTAVVLIINSLITILTMKTFITKERGEIALLKSLGFRNGSIRFWQVERILLILILSIIIGSFLSKLLAPVVIAPIFAMMGANHVVLEVKPLETYLLYPAVLLLITGIAAFLCTAEIKHIDAKEVNNIE